MALLDYLYLSAAQKIKNAPHISGEQKEIGQSPNTFNLHLRGQTLLVFLSQNKPNLKKSWDLICLKPTVFGFPQFRALGPCL
jgi:hypothetical protein